MRMRAQMLEILSPKFLGGFAKVFSLELERERVNSSSPRCWWGFARMRWWGFERKSLKSQVQRTADEHVYAKPWKPFFLYRLGATLRSPKFHEIPRSSCTRQDQASTIANLQCFVLSTLSWHSTNCVNTGIFCNQLATNAVIYNVFLLCVQKPWYLWCLCISSLKCIGIYSIFCVFCMVPAKDVKTQKCCNLRHFVSFEKQKFRPKNVNGKFFRF